MKTILAALGAFLLVAAIQPLPATAGTVLGVRPAHPPCAGRLVNHGFPLPGYAPFVYAPSPYYLPYASYLAYPPPPSFGFGRGLYYGKTFEGRGGSVRGYTFPGRSSGYEIEPR
jgi:hypothetical protein